MSAHFLDGDMPGTTILGVKLTTLFWGIVGGASAALFGPMHWKMRIVTAVVGVATATAWGPVWVSASEKYLDRWFPTSHDDVERAVIFLCGLTGMWLSLAAIEAAKRIRKDIPGVVDRLMRRISR